MTGLIIEGKSRFKIKLSHFVIFLLWVVLIFQFTVLRYIWGVELLGRTMNFLMLGIFSLVALISVLTFRFNRSTWIFYIIPSLCIFLGMFFNISVNVLQNFQLLGYFSEILPWASFLIAPFLYKMQGYDVKMLWKHFYYFMLSAIVVSLVEYFLVLAQMYPVRQLILGNGIFLAGNFTIFHMIDDPQNIEYGMAHYQFYACFAEAGTLGMVLLPAIAYAISYRRLIGLVMLLTALWYTNGFGGFIGLLMLMVILPIFYINKKYVFVAIVSCLFLTAIVWVFLGDYLVERFENKNESRETREVTIRKTFENLPNMAVEYPLGFKLEFTTSEASKNPLYAGTNFTPSNAFIVGGIPAFLGYMMCLIVSVGIAIMSVMQKNLTREDKIAFMSIIVLFPFVFQRMTFWDSAIFGFLFSPSILKMLGNEVKNVALSPGKSSDKNV